MKRPACFAAGTHLFDEFILGQIGRLQRVVAGEDGHVLSMVQNTGCSLGIDGEIQLFQMPGVIEHGSGVSAHEDDLFHLIK